MRFRGVAMSKFRSVDVSMYLDADTSRSRNVEMQSCGDAEVSRYQDLEVSSWRDRSVDSHRVFAQIKVKNKNTRWKSSLLHLDNSSTFWYLDSSIALHSYISTIIHLYILQTRLLEASTSLHLTSQRGKYGKNTQIQLYGMKMAIVGYEAHYSWERWSLL